MSDDTKDERSICEHPGCRCPVGEGTRFCSAECAKGTRGEIPRSPCACGHDTCR